MKETILSPSEIADLMIRHLSLENDNQLAQALNVQRQQINQFRKTQGGQITHKMLSVLLASDKK